MFEVDGVKYEEVAHVAEILLHDVDFEEEFFEYIHLHNGNITYEGYIEKKYEELMNQLDEMKQGDGATDINGWRVKKMLDKNGVEFEVGDKVRITGHEIINANGLYRVQSEYKGQYTLVRIHRSGKPSTVRGAVRFFPAPGAVIEVVR